MEKNVKQNDLLAAYALNMCTVSVSQIVDYEDSNVLEQEYETILNSLNLENMPKDESLLDIFRQLLDTITFFRIQEVDKEIIEMEYQHRVKNAIWNSAPNFGLIVAGGNPLTMLVSLASQVGLGYMNYRKELSNADFEAKKSYYQLKKTAIEEFNSLRRELFNTAWRLADTYSFPDEYRLTEKQIRKYNRILLEQDSLVKYERLEAIKDSFKAYPPFWYFIGNAANMSARDKECPLSDEERASLKEQAILYFKEYEKISDYNLLRDDQILAGCLVEHVDILMEKMFDTDDKSESENHDTLKETILDLVNKAVDISSNAFDTLEICALDFIRIGCFEKAEKILEILVNEKYNKNINAQLLSSIYVRYSKEKKYDILASRIDHRCLFPMPKTGCSVNDELNESFINSQRMIVKDNLKKVLNAVDEMYQIQFNKIINDFGTGELYSEFYLDKNEAERIRYINKLMNRKGKWEIYQGVLKSVDYELVLLDSLNEMYAKLFSLEFLDSGDNSLQYEKDIKEYIKKNKESFNSLQMKMREGDFEFGDYKELKKNSISSITKHALLGLLKSGMDSIDQLEKERISELELELQRFCTDNNIDLTESDDFILDENEVSMPFTPSLFGGIAVVSSRKTHNKEKMVGFAKEMLKDYTSGNNEKGVLFFGDKQFDEYFSMHMFNQKKYIKPVAIMVLTGENQSESDLIVTSKGVIEVNRGKIGFLTPLDEVEYDQGNVLLLYDEWVGGVVPKIALEKKQKKRYTNQRIDVAILFKTIHELGIRYVDNDGFSVESVSDELTGETIMDWIDEKKYESDSGLKCAVVYPDNERNSDLLNQIIEKYNPESAKYIVLYIYEEDTGVILDIHIMEYNSIGTNLQKELLENETGVYVIEL